MLYENWGILIVSIDGAATYGFLKYAAQAIDSANPLNARNILIPTRLNKLFLDKHQPEL